MDISPERLEIYRKTALKREREQKALLSLRYKRAWEVARLAAIKLKEEFGASRVVVFGSLLYPERFHLRSDIDLAGWDIRKYFRAVSHMLDIDPEFEIDLVPMEDARDSIAEVVKREGVEL